jgi:hypothetical protein
MSTATTPPAGTPPQGSNTRRVVAIAVGSVMCVIAALFCFGGGWALWRDRVARDSHGYVPVFTTTLDTDTYALTGELSGDGPRWLYGSTVVGTARIRATSRTGHTVFIGIARTGDVTRYLDGTAYATIEHLESGGVRPHAGDPPTAPPSQSPIWVTSTQGEGRQTLTWTPRAGAWSVVVMNADAAAGVSVDGDIAATVPWLGWLAAALLAITTVLAVAGIWLVVRGGRGRPTRRPGPVPQPVAPPVAGPAIAAAPGVGVPWSPPTVEPAAPASEHIDVKGEHLVDKVKQLIHEGNVRRIVINDAEGHKVLEVPVTVGVIGLLVAPSLTAVGTLGALAADYSIDVERNDASAA